MLLRDREVRAIIAHDGGQTALGYLDLIDIDAITADPKPILGYSDISLLHLMLYARTGLVGSMPTWPHLVSVERGSPRPKPAGRNWKCSTRPC